MPNVKRAGLVVAGCKRFESVVETGDISPLVASTIEPLPTAPDCGAGRVFAPRYRQAHIRVFSIGDSLSEAALGLAYQDVRGAFQHFLDNWDDGRPIVIASHSQGSWHARWLLQEFFDGKPLADRLVAAYIPGMDVYASDFQALQPCKSSGDVSCFCSWMSYRNGYLPAWLGEKAEPPAAIHPVTWTAEPEQPSLRAEHLGAVRESFRNKNPGSITATLVTEGVLWVDPPHIPFVGRSIHRENWHVGDFNLFWPNVRENVHTRIEAFGNPEAAKRP